MIKIIRKSRNLIGAPAMTDFSSIYIADDVTPDEYTVLLKHEKAHIWLEHNMRRTKDMDHETWSLACELEIARNIYNEQDIAVIKAPFSRIQGGILPDSVPNLPDDLRLCEEIYDWLMNNQDGQADGAGDGDGDGPYSKVCKCSYGDDCDNTERMDRESAAELVEKAKDAADGIAASIKARQDTRIMLDKLKKRKPSLVHEIDRSLRARVERDRSYRRPSRRENSALVMKGRLSMPKNPLVEIFVDRSGSFTPNKTAKAESALDVILKRYGASIKKDVWYFGGGRISAGNHSAGGDTPYHLIYQHLLQSRPKVAVVMTDNDACCDFPEDHGLNIVVLPIGCDGTEFAKKINGTEVRYD